MDSPVACMKRAWDAYNGIFPPSLERSKDSRGRFVGPDFNVTVNYCAPIVSIGRSFLIGKGVQFTVKEGIVQAAQDDLDLTWEANKKAFRLSEMYDNGAITGQPFIKIIPDGWLYQGRSLPRVVVLDSQQVSVETADDDIHRVLAYNVTWKTKDAAGNAITKRQRFERIDDADGLEPLGAPEQWQIRNQVRKSEYNASDPNQGWLDTEPPQAWEYDWAPIQTAPNLVNPCEFWGIPDLTPDIINLNEALNLVESNNQKIVWHFSYPHRYATGARQSDMTMGPDQIAWFASTEAKITVLDTQADLVASRAHAEDLRNAISEISGVPAIAFGREIGGGDIPAATMRLKYQALLAKTMQKRETYGELLEEVNAHLLELLGYGPGIAVKNVWPADILPRNEKEYAEAAQLWIANGVSEESAMLYFSSFNPAEEAKLKQAERERAANLAQTAMSNFDAGGALDTVMPPLDGQDENGDPAPPAGNINHPAMRRARQVAIANAGGQ